MAHPAAAGLPSCFWRPPHRRAPGAPHYPTPAPPAPRPAQIPGPKKLKDQCEEELGDVGGVSDPMSFASPTRAHALEGESGSSAEQASPGGPRAHRATGMGAATAPGASPTVKTLLRQQLERVAALNYAFSFLFLGVLSSLVTLYLLFTPFWFLSVFYFVWFYLDWDTPNRGGRRFNWVRNWTVWKLQKSYFPVKLVKTAELPPNQNYVMGVHPHGVMCTGIFCNYVTESTSFSQQFPGIRCTLAGPAGLFYSPLYRDYVLAMGMCSVSRQSLDFILSRSQSGQAVMIVIGGAHEALYSVPGKHCLVLQQRKGFVRLALRHGAALVPLYSFGENDIFKLKAFERDSWQHLAQMVCKRLIGFSPGLFWGRSIFLANFWGLLPFPKPITTVVGHPIPVPQCLNPTEEKVSHYHALSVKALEQLFEEHEESYGVPASTHLTFI
ncbi:2-acylglycerol O-acyltransferase 3 [Choloepus didactylus]|uniref:2-acylglycerol O-acyltransferase 3 n=1 Tax=Choloepus didactylus TaxID=27675 RepID=UPI00189D6A1B|nr:2-acylglycerol O-acyltransferase 3 [Choloepus didactylus]